LEPVSEGPEAHSEGPVAHSEASGGQKKLRGTGMGRVVLTAA